MNTHYKIAVIQAYIHHFKGELVQINIPRTMNDRILLEQAYSKAISVFSEIIMFGHA